MSATTTQPGAEFSTSPFEQSDFVIPFTAFLSGPREVENIFEFRSRQDQYYKLRYANVEYISLEVLKKPSTEKDSQNYSTLLVFDFKETIFVPNDEGVDRTCRRAALRLSLCPGDDFAMPQRPGKYYNYKGINLDFVMAEKRESDMGNTIVWKFRLPMLLPLGRFIKTLWGPTVALDLPAFSTFLMREENQQWRGRRDFYAQLFVEYLHEMCEVIPTYPPKSPETEATFKPFFDTIRTHGPLARGMLATVQDDRFGEDSFLERVKDWKNFGMADSVYEPF
ncbi:hypothetical protein F4779DRAFT_571392 [Xylariaceae sp. FL0662B]|nr:hypothetical protein F4779DRAFT_571392 [Xylariaceae sp. FL0662B]